MNNNRKQLKLFAHETPAKQKSKFSSTGTNAQPITRVSPQQHGTFKFKDTPAIPTAGERVRLEIKNPQRLQLLHQEVYERVKKAKEQDKQKKLNIKAVRAAAGAVETSTIKIETSNPTQISSETPVKTTEGSSTTSNTAPTRLPKNSFLENLIPPKITITSPVDSPNPLQSISKDEAAEVQKAQRLSHAKQILNKKLSEKAESLRLVQAQKHQQCTNTSGTNEYPIFRKHEKSKVRAPPPKKPGEIARALDFDKTTVTLDETKPNVLNFSMVQTCSMPSLNDDNEIYLTKVKEPEPEGFKNLPIERNSPPRTHAETYEDFVRKRNKAGKTNNKNETKYHLKTEKKKKSEFEKASLKKPSKKKIKPPPPMSEKQIKSRENLMQKLSIVQLPTLSKILNDLKVAKTATPSSAAGGDSSNTNITTYSPLKVPFSASKISVNEPLPTISTFKKPFPVVAPPPASLHQTNYNAQPTQHTPSTGTSLIVLENKVLTQAEKIDINALCLTGIKKEKIDVDVKQHLNVVQGMHDTKPIRANTPVRPSPKPTNAEIIKVGISYPRVCSYNSGFNNFKAPIMSSTAPMQNYNKLQISMPSNKDYLTGNGHSQSETIEEETAKTMLAMSNTIATPPTQKTKIKSETKSVSHLSIIPKLKPTAKMVTTSSSATAANSVKSVQCSNTAAVEILDQPIEDNSMTAVDFLASLEDIDDNIDDYYDSDEFIPEEFRHSSPLKTEPLANYNVQIDSFEGTKAMFEVIDSSSINAMSLNKVVQHMPAIVDKTPKQILLASPRTELKKLGIPFTDMTDNNEDFDTLPQVDIEFINNSQSASDDFLTNKFAEIIDILKSPSKCKTEVDIPTKLVRSDNLSPLKSVGFVNTPKKIILEPWRETESSIDKVLLETTKVRTNVGSSPEKSLKMLKLETTYCLNEPIPETVTVPESSSPYLSLNCSIEETKLKTNIYEKVDSKAASKGYKKPQNYVNKKTADRKVKNECVDPAKSFKVAAATEEEALEIMPRRSSTELLETKKIKPEKINPETTSETTATVTFIPDLSLLTGDLTAELPDHSQTFSLIDTVKNITEKSAQVPANVPFKRKGFKPNIILSNAGTKSLVKQLNSSKPQIDDVKTKVVEKNKKVSETMVKIDCSRSVNILSESDTEKRIDQKPRDVSRNEVAIYKNYDDKSPDDKTFDNTKELCAQQNNSDIKPDNLLHTYMQCITKSGREIPQDEFRTMTLDVGGGILRNMVFEKTLINPIRSEINEESSKIVTEKKNKKSLIESGSEIKTLEIRTDNKIIRINHKKLILEKSQVAIVSPPAESAIKLEEPKLRQKDRNVLEQNLVNKRTQNEPDNEKLIENKSKMADSENKMLESETQPSVNKLVGQEDKKATKSNKKILAIKSNKLDDIIKTSHEEPKEQEKKNSSIMRNTIKSSKYHHETKANKSYEIGEIKVSENKEKRDSNMDPASASAAEKNRYINVEVKDPLKHKDSETIEIFQKINSKSKTYESDTETLKTTQKQRRSLRSQSICQVKAFDEPSISIEKSSKKLPVKNPESYFEKSLVRPVEDPTTELEKSTENSPVKTPKSSSKQSLVEAVKKPTTAFENPLEKSRVRNQISSYKKSLVKVMKEPSTSAEKSLERSRVKTQESSSDKSLLKAVEEPSTAGEKSSERSSVKNTEKFMSMEEPLTTVEKSSEKSSEKSPLKNAESSSKKSIVKHAKEPTIALDRPVVKWPIRNLECSPKNSLVKNLEDTSTTEKKGSEKSLVKNQDLLKAMEERSSAEEKSSDRSPVKNHDMCPKKSLVKAMEEPTTAVEKSSERSPVKNTGSADKSDLKEKFTKNTLSSKCPSQIGTADQHIDDDNKSIRARISIGMEHKTAHKIQVPKDKIKKRKSKAQDLVFSPKLATPIIYSAAELLPSECDNFDADDDTCLEEATLQKLQKQQKSSKVKRFRKKFDKLKKTKYKTKLSDSDSDFLGFDETSQEAKKQSINDDENKSIVFKLDDVNLTMLESVNQQNPPIAFGRNVPLKKRWDRTKLTEEDLEITGDFTLIYETDENTDETRLQKCRLRNSIDYERPRKVTKISKTDTLAIEGKTAMEISLNATTDAATQEAAQKESVNKDVNNVHVKALECNSLPTQTDKRRRKRKETSITSDYDIPAKRALKESVNNENVDSEPQKLAPKKRGRKPKDRSVVTEIETQNEDVVKEHKSDDSENNDNEPTKLVQKKRGRKTKYKSAAVAKIRTPNEDSFKEHISDDNGNNVSEPSKSAPKKRGRKPKDKSVLVGEIGTPNEAVQQDHTSDDNGNYFTETPKLAPKKRGRKPKDKSVLVAEIKDVYITKYDIPKKLVDANQLMKIINEQAATKSTSNNTHQTVASTVPSSPKEVLLNQTNKRKFGRPRVNTLDPNSDKFNPRLLLITNRKQLDEDTPLTINANGNGHIQCGLCLCKTNAVDWRTHLMEHYGIGWIVGKQDPLKINSRSEVLYAMNIFFKNSTQKSLSCRMCKGIFRSGLGMLSHLEKCGAVQQRFTCHRCNGDYAMSSHAYHQRTCPALAQEKDSNADEEEVAVESKEPVYNNLGRLKRRSVVKAENRIKKFGAEILNSNETAVSDNVMNQHIKYQPPFEVAEELRKNWLSELKAFDKTFCPQKLCKFNASDLESIEEHTKQCRFLPAVGYYCLTCKMARPFSKEKKAIKHVNRIHCVDVDKDFEGNSSDYSAKSDAETSEDDVYSGVDSNQDEIAVSESDENTVSVATGYHEIVLVKKRKNNKVASYQTYRVYPPRQSNIAQWVKMRWNKFVTENFAKASLFPFVLPNYTNCSANNIEKFFPPLKSSMKFSFANTNSINRFVGTPEEFKWTELKRLQQTKYKTDTFIFHGAPIKSQFWIPVPDDSCDQFLVTLYRKNMTTYTRYLKPNRCTSLIFIYKVTEVQAANPDCNLHYIINIPDGPVHCISLLPSGGYEANKNRLGLMAVGTTTSTIKIYALPINVQSSCITACFGEVLKIIEVTPSILLCLDLFTLPTDTKDVDSQDDIQCLQIYWSETASHQYIFAGYSNGYVATWDFSEDDNENLNRFLIDEIRHFVPLNYFYTENKCVKFLHVHYDTGGPRWLATACIARKIRIFDIRDMSQPTILKDDVTRNIVRCIDWPLMWEPMLVSLCDSFPNNGRMLYLINPTNLILQHAKVLSTLTACTQTHYNPLTNIQAIAAENGDIIFFEAREYHLDNPLRHHYPECAVTMDVKCLNGAPLPKCGGKVFADGWEMCEKDNDQKYGLVFGSVVKYSTEYTNKIVLAKERLPPVNVLRYMRINSLRWNLNSKASSLLAVGYENGFMRIMKLPKENYFLS